MDGGHLGGRGALQRSTPSFLAPRPRRCRLPVVGVTNGRPKKRMDSFPVCCSLGCLPARPSILSVLMRNGSSSLPEKGPFNDLSRPPNNEPPLAAAAGRAVRRWVSAVTALGSHKQIHHAAAVPTPLMGASAPSTRGGEVVLLFRVLLLLLLPAPVEEVVVHHGGEPRVDVVDGAAAAGVFVEP